MFLKNYSVIKQAGVVLGETFPDKIHNNLATTLSANMYRFKAKLRKVSFRKLAVHHKQVLCSIHVPVIKDLHFYRFIKLKCVVSVLCSLGKSILGWCCLNVAFVDILQSCGDSPHVHLNTACPVLHITNFLIGGEKRNGYMSKGKTCTIFSQL